MRLLPQFTLHNGINGWPDGAGTMTSRHLIEATFCAFVQFSAGFVLRGRIGHSKARKAFNTLES